MRRAYGANAWIDNNLISPLSVIFHFDTQIVLLGICYYISRDGWGRNAVGDN